MGYRKPIVGAISGFVIFSSIALLGTSLYYRFMPAEYFVNYYYTKVDDSEVGKDVQFTSCRTVRGTNIRFSATRTFLLKGDNNRQFFPAGEYIFDAGIEKLPDTNCQPLRISPKRQPQEPGTYKLVTEGTFSVNGYIKHIRYESNEYKITATASSIELQIQELQARIDELKSELNSL